MQPAILGYRNEKGAILTAENITKADSTEMYKNFIAAAATKTHGAKGAAVFIHAEHAHTMVHYCNGCRCLWSCYILTCRNVILFLAPSFPVHIITSH